MSGRAVHGYETNFNKILEIGDFLIVQNKEKKEFEKRKVNMVLSDRSCGIEEAFSFDIISKTEFKYQKK